MSKAWKHFKLITKHRFIVFKLAVKAGIPWRGLVHDLSKYSFEEFLEGAKYYQGNKSPINIAREENSYSKAWLHHKGRNKHHPEYWYDWNAEEKRALVPYKYAVEMLCDHVSAGIVYKGKDWNQNYPLKYWEEIDRSRNLYNPKIEKFLTETKKELSTSGIDKVFNKKYLKEQYNKYCK